MADYQSSSCPGPLIVDRGLPEDMVASVRAGGTLRVDSELDAYDVSVFELQPGHRPFAKALGIRSIGFHIEGDGRAVGRCREVQAT